MGAPVRGNASYAYDSADHALEEVIVVGCYVVEHAKNGGDKSDDGKETLTIVIGGARHIALSITNIV